VVMDRRASGMTPNSYITGHHAHSTKNSTAGG
jgi:hypothetical protein